jgi:hypothetical protein
MIYNLPLRLTTLHFAQRLRMEGPTFMIAFSLLQLFNQRLNYTCTTLFRPVLAVFAAGLRDSQDEGVAFGDSDRMLIMRRQRPISRNYRPLVGQDTGAVCSDENHRFKRNRHTRS